MRFGPQAPMALLDVSRLRDLGVLGVSAVLMVVASVFAQRPSLRADVATLIVVYLALERELALGLILTLGVGYLADLFSGEGHGLYMASEVLVFLGLRLFVFRIVGSRFLIVTGIGLLSTWAALLMRVLIQWMFGAARPSLAAMSPALLGLLVGPVLLGYPIHRILGAIDARFRPREETLGGKS